MLLYKEKVMSKYVHFLWVKVIVFNATFNNISVIWWGLVLLVEETGVQGENHRPVTSHCQTLTHNVVSGTGFISGSIN
jgi:hypothetical protein